MRLLAVLIVKISRMINIRAKAICNCLSGIEMPESGAVGSSSDMLPAVGIAAFATGSGVAVNVGAGVDVGSGVTVGDGDGVEVVSSATNALPTFTATPEPVAKAAIPTVASISELEPTTPDSGISIPLRQLQITLALLFVILLIFTIRTARRRNN